MTEEDKGKDTHMERQTEGQWRDEQDKDRHDRKANEMVEKGRECWWDNLSACKHKVRT